MEQKKSSLRKLWTFASYIAGGYAVYNQLKTLKQAKDELYGELTPEQQAQWNKIFGSPDSGRITNPVITKPVQVVRSGISDLEKIKAGI